MDPTDPPTTPLDEDVVQDPDLDEGVVQDPEEPIGTKRRTPSGQATTDLTLSCHRAGNEDVFPLILDLYVEPGSVVADTTYGRGVFWKKVPPGRYTLWESDLREGIDARALPYITGSVDCVVFDPPYMSVSSGRTYDAMPFANYYGLNKSDETEGPKYHEALLALYLDSAREALRVLRPQGIYLVKCQDEVFSNTMRFTHIELMGAYKAMGCILEDLIVVMRANRPGVSRIVKQVHSRRNHSYFIVARSPRADRTVRG